MHFSFSMLHHRLRSSFDQGQHVSLSKKRRRTTLGVVGRTMFRVFPGSAQLALHRRQNLKNFARDALKDVQIFAQLRSRPRHKFTRPCPGDEREVGKTPSLERLA